MTVRVADAGGVYISGRRDVGSPLVHRSMDLTASAKFSKGSRYVPCLNRWLWAEDWVGADEVPNCIRCLAARVTSL